LFKFKLHTQLRCRSKLNESQLFIFYKRTLENFKFTRIRAVTVKRLWRSKTI